MKNFTPFKISLLQATLITATIFGLYSCSTDEKTEDSKEVAEEQNEAKFPTDKKEKDAEFLVNAAEINVEEIQLGLLAQQKSTQSDIKELGKMMETEHSKCLAELTALAAKKSVTIPASPTDKIKNAYEKLDEKSELNFDKEYSEMMVSGHKNAIAAFEEAATESSDSDIREWAAATLPNLRKHLDHAVACQKKYQKL